MSKLTVDLVREAIAGSRSAFAEIVAGLPRGANGEGFQIVALPLRLGPL